MNKKVGLVVLVFSAIAFAVFAYAGGGGGGGGGHNNWCDGADINHNGKVTWTDYKKFVKNYGDTNCEAPRWCRRADINHDGTVGIGDFSILAKNYGRRDCRGP